MPGPLEPVSLFLPTQGVPRGSQVCLPWWDGICWDMMGWDGMGFDRLGQSGAALQTPAGSGPASWRPHVPVLLQVWNPFASPAAVFSQQGRSSPMGLGAALAPWPICSLFIFLHLSITSQINTPQGGGQGPFPHQQRQDPALGVLNTPTPGMPLAQRLVCLARSSGRAVMPNTTMSWHPLKSAAQHSDWQEVCGAKAAPCAVWLTQTRGAQCWGGWGCPGTGTHVLSHVPVQQHRKTRLLPRVLPAQRQQHPQAAGSGTGKEPAAFVAYRGSCCSPGQD